MPNPCSIIYAATLLGAALFAILGAPAAAGAPEATCALGPRHFIRVIKNVYYQDLDASYFYLPFTFRTALDTIAIDARFARARYLSFTSQSEALRSFDSLSDVDIAAAAGSVNPFAVGANREVSQRSYRLTFVAGAAPSGSRPVNTLYSGSTPSGAPILRGFIVYRVYVPDAGLDNAGGVALPAGAQFTPAVSGACPAPRPQAADTSLERFLRGPGPLLRLFYGAAPSAAKNPPQWHISDNSKIGNLQSGIMDVFFAKRFGEALVLQGVAPTFVDTNGADRSVVHERNVRYFSFCSYDPPTSAALACARDQNVALRSNRAYAIVVSATAPHVPESCGVTWLPWEPHRGGVMMYREQLPAPSYREALKGVPFGASDATIRATLGQAYPAARYVSVTEVDRAVCSNGAPSTR